MALKAQRTVIDDRIDYFMNEVAERGGIVVISTDGSGTSMDQSDAVVTYNSTASGQYPVGLLMNDVVNLDLTRQHENWHKDEVQLGGKVTVLKIGTVTTNRVYPGVTVAGGEPAYLHLSGYLTNVNSGAAASPQVGRFDSAKDENGFAKVSINLP